MNTPTISPDLQKRRQAFYSSKELAVAAAKRGDREGARFWGMQARFDWSLIATAIASPSL